MKWIVEYLKDTRTGNDIPVIHESVLRYFEDFSTIAHSIFCQNFAHAIMEFWIVADLWTMWKIYSEMPETVFSRVFSFQWSCYLASSQFVIIEQSRFTQSQR